MAERVAVLTDSGEMVAYRWLPPSGRGPGIVLLQEIFGVSAYVQRRAQQLAADGYVVLAPAIYWRLDGLDIDTAFEGETALQDGMATLHRLDWDQAVADGAAAVRTLRADEHVSGGVGIVGFCFGGGLGFNVAAVESVDALVSYYGSALPSLLDLAPRVTVPSLHHFGLADSFIDADTVAQIERAVGGPTTTFHTYPGADHAFDNSDLPALHHPAASEQAWDRTRAWLATNLT
ncbi:dienelactone hydrolase family protein [Demetria terragena]|uniref:dienelactone hydrolase family protein n=1 Tax=Demetria terragena TaxID=63959 RepID=UPI00036C6942|nr:dienelactone hydrolase family protein [Demetria terragena]